MSKPLKKSTRAMFDTSSSSTTATVAKVKSSGKSPSPATSPKRPSPPESKPPVTKNSAPSTNPTPGPRVLNKYRDGVPHGSVNIMRPGKWGNPFHDQAQGRFFAEDRTAAVRKHKRWLLKERPDLVEEAKTYLRGKDLVCCCKPAACHGDTLLEVANAG